MTAPRSSSRHARVSTQRTRLDWVQCVQELVDVHYADAHRIVLVMDHHAIPIPASLYAALRPAEAKRLADKLEIHATPKHGSWLNMAEIELCGVQRQCLDRRLPDRATAAQAVASWVRAHNAGYSAIDWQFTTDDARIKLTRLYPTLHD